MKKEILEKLNPDGSCSIIISNVSMEHQNLDKCILIIKKLVASDILFFGLYRADGVNLTNNEFIQYNKEIPKYFKFNGRYESFNEHLAVGNLPVNAETYKALPNIFNYYLETICFSPKIDWSTFSQSYSQYINHGANNYISNGFTDCLFSYADSSDFSIMFNPQALDKSIVHKEIKEIFVD